MKHRILVVVERTRSGCSAYSPDLPGCIAAAATRQDVEPLMREAIEFHLEAMRADGIEVPDPGNYTTHFVHSA